MLPAPCGSDAPSTPTCSPLTHAKGRSRAPGGPWGPRAAAHAMGCGPEGAFQPSESSRLHGKPAWCPHGETGEGGVGAAAKGAAHAARHEHDDHRRPGGTAPWPSACCPAPSALGLAAGCCLRHARGARRRGRRRPRAPAPPAGLQTHARRPAPITNPWSSSRRTRPSPRCCSRLCSSVSAGSPGGF